MGVCSRHIVVARLLPFLPAQTFQGIQAGVKSNTPVADCRLAGAWPCKARLLPCPNLQAWQADYWVIAGLLKAW